MELDAESRALIGEPLSRVPVLRRGASASIGGAFDGANRFDRSLALWNPALNSADGDMLSEKPLADARVRDIARNDAYVQAGSILHKDSIVGSAFLLAAKPEIVTLGLDETWAEEFSDEVEAKFTLWAESPNNWVDAARTNTLTSLVRLAVGIHSVSGEVLATAEWLRDEPRPYQTAIQMIELERLSTPPEKMSDRFNIRAGIEFNSFGAPQRYNIRYAHPTDLDAGLNAYKWREVPIRKPWGRLQVIHIHEQQRIDQSRGLSDMVAALKEMKITKRFRDVTLQNAVVNATYAASIESDMPPEAAFAAIGGGQSIGDGVTNYAAKWLEAIADYTEGAKNLTIDGVKIPHLFPGTKLQLRPAGTPGGVGTEFEQSLLRYIAANLGVSYEELSRDYSKSNYSSLKAAVRQTETAMNSRKSIVADRFASAIYRLWLEEAMNKGEITSMSSRGPSWYEGLNSDAYSACEWIGAGRGQIDELKETQAAVLRLKYHLSTYEQEAARGGKKWRRVLAQREKEVRELEARNLTVAESNTVNALAGSDGEADDTRGGEDGSNTRKKDDE